MDLTVRALARQTSIYGLFQIAQRGIAFAVIPLYTYHLSPSEFGTLDILNLLVWLLGIVGGSKLDAAFVRYYAPSQAQGKVGELVGASVLGVLALATLFCVTAAMFAEPILAMMFAGDGTQAVRPPLLGFHLALITTWLELAGAIPLAFLRVRQEARLVGTISLVRALLGTATGVVLVVRYELGFTGILIGGLVSAAALVLAGYVSMLRRTSIVLSLAHAPRLYRYALPMLPAPLFMYVLNYADRFFLARHWDLAAVGLYAMSYKFAMLINLGIVSPFGEMWGANRFALYEAGERSAYRRVALLYISLLCLATLAIVYLSWEVVVFALAPQFRDAIQVVAPLALGVALWGIVPTLDLGCLVRNRTWIRSATTGITALTNVALNFLLIPPLGIAGAATASLLSYAMLAVVTYYANRRLSDYVPPMARSLAVLAVLSVFSALIYAGDSMSYAAFTGMRLFALALFAAMLLRVNDLSPRDLLRLLAHRARGARTPAAAQSPR